MANNNIEKYLEAMLAVLNGDNPPDVPTPSWNIEKYLAAILGSVDSQNPPIEGKKVADDVYLDVVQGDNNEPFYFSEASGIITTYNISVGVPEGLDPLTVPASDLVLEIDGDASYTVTYENAPGGSKLVVSTVGTETLGGYTTAESLKGKRIRLYTAETVYPPNLLNLYDADDPNGDGSYMPTYATYDEGAVTLADYFDAAPYYDRLKRGMPVWVYALNGSLGDSGLPCYELITGFCTTDDATGLIMLTNNLNIYTENYTPADEE